MLLKDFTIYFLDINVMLTLMFLFIWFTFLILNFLLWNSSQFMYKKYMYFYTNLMIFW